MRGRARRWASDMRRGAVLMPLWLVARCWRWWVAGQARSRRRASSNPNDFCTGDPCIISANKTVDAVVGGLTLDFGTRTVILQRQLTIDTLPSGAVGTVTIKAGTFQITDQQRIHQSQQQQRAGRHADHRRRQQHPAQRHDRRWRPATLRSGRRNTDPQDRDGIDHRQRAHQPVRRRGPLLGRHTSTSLSGADINLTGNIDMHGNTQGGGGSLEIAAAGNASLTGFLDISGGQGGGGFIDVNVGRIADLRRPGHVGQRRRRGRRHRHHRRRRQRQLQRQDHRHAAPTSPKLRRRGRHRRHRRRQHHRRRRHGHQGPRARLRRRLPRPRRATPSSSSRCSR